MRRESLVTKLEKGGDLALLLFAFALPLSISISQILLALLILLRVILWILGARPRILSNPWAGIFLILYAASSALSAALSPIDSQTSLKKLISMWIISLFFVSQEQVKSERQVVLTLKSLVLGALIASAYGIYQHFSCSNPIAIGIVGRVRELAGYCSAIGFFDHHLTFGTQMMMIALIGIGVTLTENINKIALYLIGVALVVVGLVLSYARGPWLGFAAGFLIFFWSWNRKVAILFSLAFIIISAAIVSISPSLMARAEAAFSSSANPDRIAMWRSTVEMIKDHTLLGVGPGIYRRAIQPYREGYNVEFLSSAHAHHNVLQELAERGVLGTAFLIAFWFTIFYVGALRLNASEKQKRGLYLGMLSALFSLWVSGMFQYNLGDAENAMLAYLICGFIIGWGGSHDIKSD